MKLIDGMLRNFVSLQQELKKSANLICRFFMPKNGILKDCEAPSAETICLCGGYYPNGWCLTNHYNLIYFRR